MRPLLALLLISLGTARGEDRWLRLKSEHFEVFTDAGAGSGREVLRRLEQIRHVFEIRTKRFNLTPLPVRVFVFRSEADFQPYQVHGDAAGYYQPGTDRDYIAMQVSGTDTYRVVYHEYTHLLLRHAGYRVPVWFNEGVAELFSTADVGRDEVRVGDLIPAHVVTLRDQRMLDLATLTTVDHDSPHYNERGKSGIFYAQSWALTHMLNFATEYRTGMANFVQMILSGDEAVRACSQAFGKSPTAVIQDLRAYLASGRFEGLRFKASRFDAARVKPEPSSGISSQLALADLLAATGKVNEASVAYGRLEASNPENAEVLLARGQFAVRMEDFSGARQYLQRAIRAGSSSPEAFHEYAIVLRQLNEPEAVVIQHLAQAVSLDDRFFPGHNLLGHLHLQAERYSDAARHLQRAADLQPNRLTVWENLAVAHHKAGDKEAARTAVKAARQVASSREEISRIEALMDLIESDADRIVVAPEANVETQPAALQSGRRVEGILSQVDCLGAKARLHVVGPEGRLLLLVRDANSVQVRGSQSVQTQLSCGQASPQPVLIEYRPERQVTYGTSGVVLSIEFR